MRLNSVAIRTTELEKSIEFYEKILGFTFDYMMSATPNKRIAFFKDPRSGMNLELIYNDRANPKMESRISLTIEVEQIAEAEKYLHEAGVKIISKPKTVKDGKKILTAVDPNGVEIDFIEFKNEEN